MDVSKFKDEIISKIQKSPKIALYSVFALICVLLLLASGSHETKTDAGISNQFDDVSRDYADFLESELKRIISKIDGIGSVDVMVTIEGTVCYEYVRDTSRSDSKYDSETVILANKEALVKQIVNPKVTGVLVICDGGDSAKIREKVLSAVSTVLDISASKVYITK